MDFMIQFSGIFRRQLLAVGRFFPESRPAIAKAATARFKVTGLKAAVRKLGDVMLTPRTAENMAAKVTQTSHRGCQATSSNQAIQVSMRPSDVIDASDRETGSPAPGSTRRS